jgi:Na+/melibiose symporter-like transporter
MQLIMGMSALESSLAIIPLMLPMMFLSPIIPNIVKKFGARSTISVGLLMTAIAFVLMSFWTKDLSYGQLFFTMIIMMLGISAAMTPGTNILMASVPRNRSGMGSAMNDTTRELGSALGVAVLGAILSSVYEKNIAETARNFSGAVKEGLESSLAVALRIGESLGPASTTVMDAAKTAWMDGLSAAALVAAAIIFVCAIIAFVGLPKHVDKASDTL